MTTDEWITGQLERAPEMTEERWAALSRVLARARARQEQGDSGRTGSRAW